MKKYLIILLILVFSASMFFVGIGCKTEAAVEEAVEEAMEEVEEAVEEEPPAEITDEPMTINFWVLAGPMNEWAVQWKALYECAEKSI